METEHTAQPSAEDSGAEPVPERAPDSVDTNDDIVADTVGVLRGIWDTTEDDRQALEECAPGHHCKNMRHVSFDGLGDEDGTDAATAWRELLAREGKLDTSGGTIRDLVLGRPTDR
jgi:hypothetical protein